VPCWAVLRAGPQRVVGTGLVAAAAMLWGCWSLVLRPAGLTGIPSALVVLAVMGAPAPFVLRRAPFRDRGAALALLLLGIADAGNAGLYFAAIQRGPVSVAVLTHYLAPVIVALAAPAILGEAPSRRARAAAPLSLLGLALLVWRPGAGLPLETALLGAGSALFYAVIVFSAKRAERSFSPLAVTALHAPLSAALLLAFGGRAALPAMEGGTLLLAAGAAVFGLGGSVLFYTGLRRVSSQVAGALTYLEPLTATLLGWAVFSERLDVLALAGAALVLACGVAVALERE